MNHHPGGNPLGPLGMWFRPIPEVLAVVEQDEEVAAVVDRDADAATAVGGSREHVYHPWLTTWVGPKTTAAGVITCVTSALLTAFVLNTGYVMSTIAGMPDGFTKKSLSAVANPVHEYASAAGLGFLSDSIQLALGRSAISDSEFDTSNVLAVVDPSPTGIGGAPSGASVGVPPSVFNRGVVTSEQDSTQVSVEDSVVVAREPALLPNLIAPYAKNAPTRPLPAMAGDLAQPTSEDRLRVLIVGDSLSTYPGFLLQESFADIDAIRSKLVWHNGTGLTKPQLLDWRQYLADQVQKRKIDSVIVFLGANDMGSMTKKGKTIAPHTDRWRGEYALRVASVAEAAIQAGASSVLWVGPPTARSKQIDKFYGDINAALGAASEVIDGLYVIDLATGNPYVETTTRGSQRIQLRQADGIHWTRQGSAEPANAVLTVLETGYPSLSQRFQAVRSAALD